MNGNCRFTQNRNINGQSKKENRKEEKKKKKKQLLTISAFVYVSFQSWGNVKVKLGLNLLRKDLSKIRTKVTKKPTLTKKQIKTMGKQLKNAQQAIKGFTQRLSLMRTRTRNHLRDLKTLKIKKVYIHSQLLITQSNFTPNY